MSVFHIGLIPVQEYQPSYFGGLPHLRDDALWPICPSTGQVMLHLFTLGADFFPSPTLNAEDALSVFISYDHSNPSNTLGLTRDMAVNDQNQLSNLELGYCKVLLHRASERPCKQPIDSYKSLPICKLETIPFTDTELKEEVAEPDRGLDVSKLLGIPGWLQDEIFIHPRYSYLMQLNEYDVRKISAGHAGLFREGVGYLYLNNNVKRLKTPIEAGYFFIQFT